MLFTSEMIAIIISTKVNKSLYVTYISTTPFTRLEGVEIDSNELPECVKEEIMMELNHRVMIQIGYEEMK